MNVLNHSFYGLLLILCCAGPAIWVSSCAPETVSPSPESFVFKPVVNGQALISGACFEDSLDLRFVSEITLPSLESGYIYWDGEASNTFYENGELLMNPLEALSLRIADSLGYTPEVCEMSLLIGDTISVSGALGYGADLPFHAWVMLYDGTQHYGLLLNQ